MKIKQVNFFLLGLIILIVGVFIVVFDYTQIQYFDQMDPESYFLLDEEQKNIHQRLQIEFTIGLGILGLGILFFGFSFTSRSLKIKF